MHIDAFEERFKRKSVFNDPRFFELPNFLRFTRTDLRKKGIRGYDGFYDLLLKERVFIKPERDVLKMVLTPAEYEKWQGNEGKDWRKKEIWLNVYRLLAEGIEIHLPMLVNLEKMRKLEPYEYIGQNPGFTKLLLNEFKHKIAKKNEPAENARYSLLFCAPEKIEALFHYVSTPQQYQHFSKSVFLPMDHTLNRFLLQFPKQYPTSAAGPVDFDSFRTRMGFAKEVKVEAK